MRKLKIFSLLMILTIAASLVVGCAPKTEEPTPVAEETEEPVVEETEEVEEPEPEVEEPTEEAETEEPEPDPVTLTLWTEYTASPKSELVQYWIDTFQEKYPWITVEHKGISNEVAEETLRVALLGQDPPDIFLPQSRGEVVDYVDAGALLDLTDFYNERIDRFNPTFDAISDWQTVVGGQRYAIPYTVLHVNMIWYNDALLKEYGIEATEIKTLEDLMGACDILKENDVVCFQLGGGSTWPVGHWAQFFIQQNLPEETWKKLATGEKSWTDPDIVEAVSYLEEMYEAGYFQPGVAADTRDVSRAAYFQGNGAFFAAGSWHLYQKGGELAPPDWEFKFIPFPSAADSPIENPVISTVNVLWSISSKTEHPEEAKLFLAHVTSLQVAQKHVEMLQEFVVFKDAVTPENASDEMVAIAEWTADGTGINFLENYFTREVIQEGLWGGTLGVLTGQATTEEWMQLCADLQATSGNLEFEE